MSKVVRHLKQNVVAYLALFVALGGTSYAAISIPRNAIGAKQIRNHSIDPAKLDGRATSGYIRFWAQIDANGKVSASSPRATTVRWNASPGAPSGGLISWNHAISGRCFSLATAVGPTSADITKAQHPVDTVLDSGSARFAGVLVSLPAAVPVNVAVICPIP